MTEPREIVLIQQTDGSYRAVTYGTLQSVVVHVQDTNGHIKTAVVECHALQTHAVSRRAAAVRAYKSISHLGK